jgi:hypothetical protein
MAALDVLDPRVIDAAANGNFKATMDLSTQTTQQMGINQQGHADRLNRISEGVLGESLGQRAGIDITESQAVRGVVASDLARQVTDAVLAALATKLVTPVTTEG